MSKVFICGNNKWVFTYLFLQNITKVKHKFVESTFQTILIFIKGLKLVFYCQNIKFYGPFSPKIWILNSKDGQLREKLCILHWYTEDNIQKFICILLDDNIYYQLA